MRTLYRLWSLARADFLERARGSSYLVTLGLTVYLGYAVDTGKVVLKMNEYRGTPDSLWFATSMQLACIIFISLFGFYVVKNGIQRDDQTRVGRVLAATPLRKPLYTLGKALSNFLVLASIVMVLACAALILQLLHGEPATEYGTVLLPFLLAALPAMACVGALAVLFESISALRGTLGNVVYFFLWIGLLSVALITGLGWLDYSGVGLMFGNMDAALQAVAPGYPHGLQFNPGDVAAPRLFPWRGIRWTTAMVVGRLAWIAVSAAIAILAALFFSRFDPAKERILAKTLAAPPVQFPEDQTPSFAASVTHLTALPTNEGGFSFGLLLISELKLMLKGLSLWWYLIATGLVIACVATPASVSRMPLVFAWIWPLRLWSQMGTRDSRYATSSLLCSAPSFLWRQLPAEWLAGLWLTGLLGLGTLGRALLAGDLSFVLPWVAACLFIPSMALALGIWTRGTKAFEVLYLLWWYAGPLDGVPALDFMGITPGSRRPLLYGVLTVMLLSLSFLGRSTRLRPAR